jgi:catechol 2,3-dioxygenase-like lactoylglutathione lyase family enzyme
LGTLGESHTRGGDPARAAAAVVPHAGWGDRFFQARGAARSYGTGMDIQFIASIAVITPAPQKSRELFIDALGLPLEASPGSDYFHSERIEGSKHFGVWPLSQAAQACFGTPDWPPDRTVPQMSLEFEVHDADAVRSAAEELRQRGFTLLHDRREEPWGQTVARLQSQEGSIIGISFAPSLHD